MARNESNVFNLEFPYSGLHRSVTFEDQPRGSTVDVQNMRPWNFQNGRRQGSQRPGLARYLDAQMTDHPVRDISLLVTTASEALSATSIATRRSIQGLAVCNGTIYEFDTTSFTTPTGGSSALSASAPVVFSAPLFDTMYFVEGANYVKYNGGTVSTWTASAGSLPTNSTNKCRLIELWNARIVMAGLIGDRHNWFMSKKGDASDWDYSPATVTVLTAAAGNNADAGKVGDIINAMIPYDDDTLIFLCDHSIWRMTGDPQEGGRIDKISDTTGGAWGRPWTKDDKGTIYFFGSRGGIFRMSEGSKPEEITLNRIDQLLSEIDLDTNLVRLGWDDDKKTLHVFVSPLTEGAATHFAWDQRTDSWWIDVFGDNNHNPLAVCLFDADDFADRRFLIGGMDGRIRYFDEDSKNDDGTAIDAFVYLGPVKGSQDQRVKLNEMTANIVTGSDAVTWDQYRGESAQAAYAASSYRSGTFSAGRSYAKRLPVAGHSIFIRLRNNTSAQWWGMEWLRCQISSYTSGTRRFF